MLFNSYVFIYLFVPTVWVLYQLARRLGPAAGEAFLLAASLFFYGYWDARLLPLLLGSILINWTIARAMGGLPRDARGGLMRLGVVFNLGLLFVFKYAGFLSVNLAAATGIDEFALHVVLPIGISFFTFQQIAFLVDLRRGEAEVYGLTRYGLFISFFPQLIAGPIVHHREIAPQLTRMERATPRQIATGLSIFTAGLFKKTVIADNLARVVAPVFAAADRGDPVSHVEALAGSVAYSLQIYFDFSGYSDMAIGLGLLFGIRLPINFDSPLKSASIIEFWRRWHITLSSFLRDYLYIPLGGGRRGPARRYLNLMLTMTLGGLWHGAGWGFLIWGMLHGAFLMINHVLIALGARLPALARVPRWIGVAVTFLAVAFALIFFRATHLSGAVELSLAAAGLSTPTLPGSFQAPLGPVAAALTGVGATFGGPAHVSLGLWATVGAPALIAGMLIALFAPNTNQLFLDAGPRPRLPRAASGLVARTGLVAGAFAAAVLFASTVSEFLYFQF